MLAVIYAVITIVIAALAFVGWGFYKVIVLDTKNYAAYWQERAAEPIPTNAIKLVALGDSTFQAIGASKPELGTVGRVVDYLEQKTGRPVHVSNFSVSGGKVADVIEQQLPQAHLASADIVIVAVGANDALKKTDLKEFEATIETLAAALPAEKTVVADVADVKNREAYQQFLLAARDERGIMAADLRKGFADVKYPWRLSARDFFHPSDYGYSYWFASFRPAVNEIIARRQLAK